MKRFLYITAHLFDIFYSFFVSIRLFGLAKAFKFPVLFKFGCLKEYHHGNIVINSTTKKRKHFSIKIGIDGVEGISCKKKTFIKLGKNAKLIFKDKANLSKGLSIRLSAGQIEFGNNFYSNNNLSIVGSKSIVFGDNCIVGWNTHIRDLDGHKVISCGTIINEPQQIIIGNHVWICQNVSILKGTRISDNSIIAANACVTNSFEESNVVIGGCPAKVIKKNIDWMI